MLLSTLTELTITTNKANHLFIKIEKELNRLGYVIQYTRGFSWVDFIGKTVYICSDHTDINKLYQLAHESVHILQWRDYELKAVGYITGPAIYLRARLYAHQVGKSNPQWNILVEWEATALMYSPKRVLKLLKRI